MFLFLVGCASLPDREVSKSSTQKVDSHSAEPEDDSEKVTAISPDVLYLLLTAEIAGQRNQYDVALDGYLQAAKRVNDPRISERAAKIGVFLKNTDKTAEAVSLWLKQDDKNLTARKIAALSALRSGDRKTALAHLNRILADDPAGFESTLMELTKVLAKDGRADVIFSVLEDVAVQHPEQAVVYFVQALLAGKLNKVNIAKEKVNKALELEPSWNKALILRAQLAAQAGELDVARENLEKILEKTPDNDRVKKMLAQVLVKAKALEDALQLYQEMLTNKPDDAESQFAIALIYLQQEKEHKALVKLKEMVNRPRWGAQASFYIGRIEYKNEHYAKALVWFDKVTQGAYHYEASMAAVSVLLSQKNFVEAESRLSALAVEFPKQKIQILLLETEVYSEQKDYQKAFDILTDALKKHPDHRNILYTRALISEKLDRLDLLESDLKKILLKNPDDASTLNALGYTLVDRTDRFEEAGGYLQRAIKLKPEEAVILDSIGWLHFKQGETMKALKYLRAAYEKQPESEIAAHLAEVLWSLGDKEEAKNVFDKAIKKSPDDEYLLKIQHKFLDMHQ
jgi:tetratricopeptide (TPR) repeat protein